MRYLLTLAAAAALLTVGACADTLSEARQKAADAGYSNPTCVHSYLPHPIGKFDAKGQHCTASDGRVAWVNGSKVTEAK